MKAPSIVGKYLDELSVGDTWISQHRKITETDIIVHAGHGGDFYQLHFDDEFARAQGFNGRIIHGNATISMCGGFLYQTIPHQGMIIAHIGGTYELGHPVHIGETIYGEHVVQDMRPSKSKPDRGIVIFRNTIRTIDDKDVLNLDITFMWRRQMDGNA